MWQALQNIYYEQGRTWPPGNLAFARWARWSASQVAATSKFINVMLKLIKSKLQLVQWTVTYLPLIANYQVYK